MWKPVDPFLASLDFFFPFERLRCSVLLLLLDNMKTTTKDGFVTVEQTPVIIPDLTVKDLLSAIPYVLERVPGVLHC